jgi:nucleoside-diphosphate-sugar epimerase
MKPIIHMKNKTIGVTGSSGVIGNKFINKFKNNSFIKCTIDIQDRKKVFQWIGDNQFDLLLHFAAIVPINEVNKDKLKAKSVNYIGTKNIVDALVKYKKKKNIWFFYSSTSHVYKYSKKKITEKSKIDPINYYGKTKLMSEKYIIKNLKNDNIKYCIGRIFSFTDKLQKKTFFIPAMFKRLRSKNTLTIQFYDMESKRDFISTKDIIYAIKTLYEKSCTGIFNIGSGRSVKLSYVINFIAKILKNKNNIEFINNKINQNITCDNTKIKKIGWKAKINIQKILEEYKKNL